jgi:Flp pilus assembly protein TadD
MNLLTEAIENTKKGKGCLWKRATIYVKRGEYDLAIRDFGLVLVHEPENKHALIERAKTLFMVGQNELAERDCDEVLRLSPTDASMLEAVAKLRQ